MARGVKLRRYEIKHANHYHLRGYRLKVEVADACGMDPNVFVYRRKPADPTTGVVVDEFCSVASFPDMAEYPSLAPDPAKQPFFRMPSIEVDVRSARHYEEIWRLLLSQVAALVSALNRADVMIVGEEAWLGAAGPCSDASESDGGGSGGGPGFSTYVIIPSPFVAGHFAGYDGATGRLVDTGYGPLNFAPAGHAAATNNPHGTTAAQVGAYTQAQVNALIAAIQQDEHYHHTQGSPSTTWTINHNLGKVPALLLLNNAGQRIYGDESYPDSNTAVVTFSIAIFGEAYAN